MRTEARVTAPSILGLSWLAAIGAFPFALITAATGQGLGALLGGCHWIGLSLPIDRQVWALVNQPALNFSSLPSAGGYWLGSLVLPLLIAVAAIPLLPRGHSMVIELLMIQWAWGSAVIAVAWLPLLEPGDGHLSRWLALHHMSTHLLWIAPGMAAAAGVVPTIRLLQLARRRPGEISRVYRLAVVVLHLGAPAVVWAAMTSLISGQVPVAAAVGLLVPVAASIVLGWFRYPDADVRPLGKPTVSASIGLAVAAIIAVSVLWYSGMPVADEKRAGRLWSQPQAFNNIRSWIAVLPALPTSIDPLSPVNGAEVE